MSKSWIFTLLTVPLWLAFLTISSCSIDSSTSTDIIFIENVTVIDPIDGELLNQSLIIQEERIVAMAPASQMTAPANSVHVDGSGKFVIPGLWDAHVHFAYQKELAPRMFDLFMAYGITSVRDTGGKIAEVKKWQDEARRNPGRTPRVMIAGPLLDGMPNVYDGSPGRPELSVGLGSVNAVERKVAELDSLGVDLLKAYEMLTPEQFARLVALGKEKGLKITGHVPLSMHVIKAAENGLNSMEHMRNLELSCASNWQELHEQRLELLSTSRNDPGGILRSRIHTAQRENAVQNFSEARADTVLREP